MHPERAAEAFIWSYNCCIMKQFSPQNALYVICRDSCQGEGASLEPNLGNGKNFLIDFHQIYHKLAIENGSKGDKKNGWTVRLMT